VSGRESTAPTVSDAGDPPGPAIDPYHGPAAPSLPAGATTSTPSASAPLTASASGLSAKPA